MGYLIKGLPDKEYMKRYYQVNKEHIKKLYKIYYQTHQNQISKSNKIYYINNKSFIDKRIKKYENINAIFISKRKKCYYIKNKIRIDECNKKYNLKHKESIKEYSSCYRKEHKFYIKNYFKKYYATLNGKKVFYKLKMKRKENLNNIKHNFTFEEWQQKKVRTKGICSNPYNNLLCLGYVGIDKLTIDHNPPISKVSNGFIYNIHNVNPLCLSCNVSKGNRIM